MKNKNEKDILLEELMKPERWIEAIDIGVDKHLNKTELRKLATPQVRIWLYEQIKNDNYEIYPPTTIQIPKDKKKKEFRTVYKNEDLDRIILSIVNNMLFDLCPEFVHKNCRSYQKGQGCGKIVQDISKKMGYLNRKARRKLCKVLGFKADLSKYFDSVPIEFIDAIFDRIEKKFGKSKVISMVRKYYHQDAYFDEDGNLCFKFQSLKQGCALASFLADALLYELDEMLSGFEDSLYVRYSDDILFLGEEYEMAKQILETCLKAMDMKLNPKKFELITYDKWFKFLGYELCGDMISFGSTRLENIEEEIRNLTINQKHNSLRKAVNAVNRYFYKGEYSVAASILRVINVEKDIKTVDQFVFDCLRAVQTGKKEVGGLGIVLDRKDSCVDRGTGKGKNVKYNKANTQKWIEGYSSLNRMRKALLDGKPVYDTLVRQM